MDLWHGRIDFDDGRKEVHDLHFSHPHVKDHCLPHNASLRFLGTVETVDIPFYLVSGPSLDVWTTNEHTSKWLHQCLIDDANDDGGSCSHPTSQRSGTQSQHGILLGVQSQHDGAAPKGLKTTEILLYAATGQTSQQDYTPPSPPASSSPSPEVLPDNATPKIRLYALPLSSEIFKVLDRAPALHVLDTDPENQNFYYLPPPSNPQSSQQETTQARKRLKVETLFQDATQNRRLQKKQGGQGVAKIMAGDQTLRSQFPSSVLPQTVHTIEKPPARRKPLGRSFTTGTLPAFRAPTASSSTSTSTTAHPNNQRRASLLRTSSALSPSIDGAESPIPVPENEAGGNIEQSNKTSLRRVIMSGMRMYGFELNVKKNTGSNDASVPSTSAAAITTSPDEYKNIYHQTYKATAFVFRSHFSRQMLPQEVLRDTVDGFLGRFCRDPLAGGGEEEDVLG